MDPCLSGRSQPMRRLPRSRGDGPDSPPSWPAPPTAAPLTRGWTPGQVARGGGRQGCPAHAGMDPACIAPRMPLGGLPRSRGDGPGTEVKVGQVWEAAPLTRGWTPWQSQAGGMHTGCPAHAGMDPTCARRRPTRSRLPRSRGDGPIAAGLCASCGTAAPLTRGWTPQNRALPQVCKGCPAHAGMDPNSDPRGGRRHRLPRSRGDGPKPEH
ncbi:MAG: hypothetical protein RL223_4246 [Pseudomonadota bacterium]